LIKTGTEPRPEAILPAFLYAKIWRKVKAKMIEDVSISSVLAHAKQFKKPERPRTKPGGYQYVGKTYTNLGEILTPEELAQRLKVSVAWITEKRRPRCPNPIPALPIGKQIRFDWDSVVKWLEDCAAAEAKSLRERRTNHKPQRRKPSKNLIAFPNLENEETDETAPPKRKHR
jgi:hypothetical protein